MIPKLLNEKNHLSKGHRLHTAVDPTVPRPTQVDNTQALLRTLEINTRAALNIPEVNTPALSIQARNIQALRSIPTRSIPVPSIKDLHHNTRAISSIPAHRLNIKVVPGSILARRLILAVNTQALSIRDRSIQELNIRALSIREHSIQALNILVLNIQALSTRAPNIQARSIQVHSIQVHNNTPALNLIPGSSIQDNTRAHRNIQDSSIRQDLIRALHLTQEVSSMAAVRLTRDRLMQVVLQIIRAALHTLAPLIRAVLILADLMVAALHLSSSSSNNKVRPALRLQALLVKRI